MSDQQKRREHDEVVVDAALRTLGNQRWLETLDDDLWEKLQGIETSLTKESIRRRAEKALREDGLSGLFKMAWGGAARDE